MAPVAAEINKYDTNVKLRDHYALPNNAGHLIVYRVNVDTLATLTSLLSNVAQSSDREEAIHLCHLVLY